MKTKAAKDEINNEMKSKSEEMKMAQICNGGSVSK